MTVSINNVLVVGRTTREPKLTEGGVIFSTVATERYAGPDKEPYVSYVDFRTYVKGQSQKQIERLMRTLAVGNSVKVAGELRMMTQKADEKNTELTFVAQPNDIEINAYSAKNAQVNAGAVAVEAEAVPVESVPVQ